MIFAVDFDGTLNFGQYPEAGPANEGLIDFLIERKSKGDKLILWTCREGEALRLAVDLCKNQGLVFATITDWYLMLSMTTFRKLLKSTV